MNHLGLNRLVRVAIATSFLVGVLSASRLSLPGLTVACSCMAPEPGAPLFTGQEEAVLVGTVGPSDGRGVHAFTVERWFRGGDAAVVGLQSGMQTFPDGTTAFNTCGLTFEVGERLILAAGRIDATLSPSSCSPHAGVASAEGQALVAAAIRTFGEGTVPGAPPGVDFRSDPGPDLGLIAIALVGLIVLAIVVIGVLAFARREPRETRQP